MAILDMLMTASRHADAWIEPRVEQVAQQREDCEEGGEYYDHCLDRGNVPPRDRFSSQVPQPLQGEYRFGDDRAAEENAELTGRQRDERDHRVTQGVPDEHGVTTQPFRSRSADIVGLQDVEHPVAGQPHQDRTSAVSGKSVSLRIALAGRRT